MSFSKVFKKENGSPGYEFDPLKNIVYEQEPEESSILERDVEEFANKGLSAKLELLYRMLVKLEGKISIMERDRQRDSEDIVNILQSKFSNLQGKF